MKKFFIFLFISLVFFSNTFSDIFGPRLQFLIVTYNANQRQLFKLPSQTVIPVSLKFKTPVDVVSLEKLLPQCVELYKVSDKILHSTHVVVAKMDFSKISISDLQNIPDLLEVESLWRPQQMLPLNVSRPQIQSERMWEELDWHNQSITGKEVLIADFDTGINLFHPAFYFADGDTFIWHDIDQNGKFDPGYDGVDKNRNRIIETDEVLNFISVQSHLTNPPDYNPSLDWLYNDMNNNQQRDYGPNAGFKESDPTYGEPLYIALDTNRDDILDIGEKLVALGTCKVRKAFQSNGTILARGEDLIYNEGDTWGHGTPVSGIMIGGIAGIHQLAGIAPDAELLMGVNVYIPDPPFIQTMEILAPWAATEEADIMLYEDGEWIWQYMDGSSALETMINDFAAEGIIQIVPAGNLAGGGMHTSANVYAQDSLSVSLSVVNPGNQQKIWGNFLWQSDSSALMFRLIEPEGERIILAGEGSYQPLSTFQIYSLQSRSPRGTNRMDFLIMVTSNTLSGTFTFRLINSMNERIEFHAYLWDDISGWYGNTQWNEPNDDNTITWPATADSAITVAAYNPRDNTESLNSFSGRGKRIDRLPILDISAPGSVVYSTSASSSIRYAGYTQFGGTSSAGPHVAGAIALLLQYDSTMTSGEIRLCLHQGANTKNIAGSFPDDEWGYGRLRIYDAFQQYLTPVYEKKPPLPINFSLSAAPNPFNSSVIIYYMLDESCFAELSIYNTLGQKVKTLFNEFQNAGEYRILWNAQNQWGSDMASGVYFVRLKTNHKLLIYKIALVR